MLVCKKHLNLLLFLKLSINLFLSGFKVVDLLSPVSFPNVIPLNALLVFLPLPELDDGATPIYYNIIYDYYLSLNIYYIIKY